MEREMFYYKNFNMGTEIDIAGNFIYKGMSELEKIKCFYYESDTFSFLYPVSIGIERLQKVLIVLSENIMESDMEEFEKSLITHNHQQLQERISRTCGIKLNSRQNGFLQLISEFYKSCRYNRFNYGGDIGYENTILYKYIIQNCERKDINTHFINSEKLMNSDGIKKMFGKTIGSISTCYYNSINRYARDLGIYTYELRSGENASRVFLGAQLCGNSLHKLFEKQKNVTKEVIIYLVNSADHNDSAHKFLRTIEPLDLSGISMNDMVDGLCSGELDESIADYVEHQWSEETKYKERRELLDVVGNVNVDFSFGAIMNIKKLLHDTAIGTICCETFAEQFLKELEWIDDEDDLDLLEEVKDLCNHIINVDKEEKSEFIQKLIPLLKETLIAYETILSDEID